MKLSTFTIVAAMAAVSNAYMHGFNMASKNADGTCKEETDWVAAFRRIQSIKGGPFNQVRLSASYECGALARAVPAALKTGTHLLVGLATEDASLLNAEKLTLLDTIKRYGSDWMTAISVGSDDIHRKAVTAKELARQIRDIRDAVRAVGVKKPVGHADHWTAWVAPENEPVISAVDFVGVNAYTHSEAALVNDSLVALSGHIFEITSAVNKVNSGLHIWVTETGWPVGGQKTGLVTPSVQDAQTYWRGIACTASPAVNTYWYLDQDSKPDSNFGVFGRHGMPLFDTSCYPRTW